LKEPNPYDIPDGFKKIGRKFELEVDLEQIEILAKIGCTKEEIGRLTLNMSGSHFADLRKERPEIEAAIEAGRANLQKSIRHAQVKAGVNDGNVQMLIHLGKHYLDQREKMDVNQHVSGEMVIETEFRKTDEPAEEEGNSS
jgi:hypothetical protein